jgi:hypothetical protein
MNGEEEGLIQYIPPTVIWDGDRIVLDSPLISAGEWPPFDRLEETPDAGAESLRHDMEMIHPDLRSGPLEERLHRVKGCEHRDLYCRLGGGTGGELWHGWASRAPSLRAYRARLRGPFGSTTQAHTCSFSLYLERKERVHPVDGDELRRILEEILDGNLLKESRISGVPSHLKNDPDHAVGYFNLGMDSGSGYAHFSAYTDGQTVIIVLIHIANHSTDRV